MYRCTPTHPRTHACTRNLSTPAAHCWQPPTVGADQGVRADQRRGHDPRRDAHQTHLTWYVVVPNAPVLAPSMKRAVQPWATFVRSRSFPVLYFASITATTARLDNRTAPLAKQTAWLCATVWQLRCLWAHAHGNAVGCLWCRAHDSPAALPSPADVDTTGLCGCDKMTDAAMVSRISHLLAGWPTSLCRSRAASCYHVATSQDVSTQCLELVSFGPSAKHAFPTRCTFLPSNFWPPHETTPQSRAAVQRCRHHASHGMCPSSRLFRRPTSPSCSISPHSTYSAATGSPERGRRSSRVCAERQARRGRVRGRMRVTFKGMFGDIAAQYTRNSLQRPCCV